MIYRYAYKQYCCRYSLYTFIMLLPPFLQDIALFLFITKYQQNYYKNNR